MYFIVGRFKDESCPFNKCKDVTTLLSAFNNEFRNFFFINVHKILLSTFECIESDSLFKYVIKISSLMEVALLASMRMEAGFDQGPSMNGTNFKIIC